MQIAAAVTRLVTTPALRARLVQNGYSVAMERFSRAASARAFAQVFSALLRRRTD